jgi:dihydroneopterin aldolase
MQGFEEDRFAAVLEGFTEEAREAVARAQEEAARLGHGQANTGHLLLGILRDGGGVAARALAALNVTPDGAREVVENVGGRGEEGTLDRGPFTPRLARVVELAPREAARAGQERVGGGHLLLGLVREANSVGVRVLSALDVSPADVRREVFGRLRNPSRREPREPPSRAGPQERPDSSEPPDRTDEETAASEEAPPMTVRGRVEGLEVHVRCGVSEEERALPQALLVDLQYVYDAQPSDDLSGVVDYGTLMEEAARALEREEFMLLETGARRIGARVLEKFPTIREMAVTVTKPRVPIARTVSGVSVRAVFRR